MEFLFSWYLHETFHYPALVGIYEKDNAIRFLDLFPKCASLAVVELKTRSVVNLVIGEHDMILVRCVPVVKYFSSFIWNYENKLVAYAPPLTISSRRFSANQCLFGRQSFS